MPRKAAALLGPGTGPKVQVKGKARISLRGIKPGEFAQVSCMLNDQEDVMLSFTEDGEYDMHPCRFAYVMYGGKNVGFIACVLMGD